MKENIDNEFTELNLDAEDEEFERLYEEMGKIEEFERLKKGRGMVGENCQHCGRVIVAGFEGKLGVDGLTEYYPHHAACRTMYNSPAWHFLFR